MVKCAFVMVAVALGGGGCDDVKRMGGESKVDLTKVKVRQVAHDWYPRWSLKNPDATCPSSLLEVARAVDPSMTEADVTDPYASPYKFLCGASLPAGARGLAVYSFGENRKDDAGAGDDIKSW